MSQQNPRAVTPGLDPSHAFSRIPQADIQRSRFDLSHPVLTNQDAGYIYICTDFEVLPGDTFDLGVTGVIQMLSLKQQLMDSLYMDLHWWFVPMRLVYENWELLQGQRPDPDSSIDKLVPIITVPTGGFVAGSLADDMGWPIGIPAANWPKPVTATVFRAHNLIFNTWYKDQNLIDNLPVPTDDGPDAMSNYVRVRRGKRKDVFTSALPFAQKGTAPTISLGTTAPVTGTTDAFFGPNFDMPVIFPTTGLVTTGDNVQAQATAGQITGYSNLAAGTPENLTPLVPAGMGFSGIPFTGSADLSAATAVTVNALRQVVAIQHLLELYARGGTRYTESIYSLFGVTSPDARLQRPEYLGGTTIPIMIHSVVNQTQLNAGSAPLGQRASFGHAQFNQQAQALHSFTEHGVIVLLSSVRQEYRYWQGIPKRHTRRGLYEYYMPPLANLGEEPIYNWELLVDGSANDLAVFGYQERWYDYRNQIGKVTHLMRPSAAGTLASWHLAQTFTNTPNPFGLTQDFIEENPPMDRVVAVPSEPIFNVDLWVSAKATRPLPLYSVPGLETL